MYDVLTISKYVIKQFNLKYNGIHYLKLNSLLFYIQVAFIKIKGTQCFKEDILATSCGVKVEIVTKQYEWNGLAPILYDLNFDAITVDDNIIKEEDRKLIDDVIDEYAYTSLSDLVDNIIKQTVWLKVYYSVIRDDKIITIDDIRQYCVDRESEYKRIRKGFVLVK